MLSDLRLAFRQLAKAPGFAAVAILTLALAIGVNSAVFSLVDAVVLRPVVSLRPDELVTLFNGREGPARDFRLFSHAEYLAVREARDTFADTAATLVASAGIERAEGIRKAQAFFTSDNYFALLGVQPALGRFYNAEEARPNASIPVVVASHDLWQSHGGHPDFVNSTLRVNGKSYTVIGVAPATFNGVLAFERTDLWLPLGAYGEFAGGARRDLAASDSYRLTLLARLAPGVSRSSLSARLPIVAQRLAPLQADASAGARALYAEAPSRSNISSQPSGGDPALPLAIGALSMSGCVLVIACLNLANMLLARGASRSREIAVRLALGADRWRIVRQLLAEGLVLAGCGGAAGLLLGAWTSAFLVNSLRSMMTLAGAQPQLAVQLDERVVGVTFLLCLVATLVFSLGPALKSSRADLVHDLKQQGAESGATGRLNRFFSLGHCLVMGQIALSLALLFAAGLFLRGALKASTVVPGFDPAGAVVADLDYSLTPLAPDEARVRLAATLERLAEQPGVGAVAAASFVPYASLSNGNLVRPAGTNDPARSFGPLYTGITPGYFEALGVRLTRGRTFTAAEAADPTARVAIVDEVFARKLFPTGEPLGQRIQVGNTEREIVGLCMPHRHNNRRALPQDRVFVPYAAEQSGRVFVLVRYGSGGAATTGVATLRTSLRTLDPALPVRHLDTLASMIANDFTLWLTRLGAVLFGFFGVIALVLAVVGVYGVKAYMVSRRTREIGIRMAIGAQPRDVFALLLKQGALQILVAATVGLGLCFGAGQILANILYQVSPMDPLALGVSTAVLTVATLLACFLPARRATKVNPLIALRAE